MKEPKRIIGNSVKAFNKLWRWSKLNKKPCLTITKKIKYATLDYDMWTINYDLSENAIKELENIWNDIIKENFNRGGKKSVWHSVSKSTGFISDILIEVAINALPKVKATIFEASNWVPITLNAPLIGDAF